MDETGESERELERQLAQAKRLAAVTTDLTTYQRLREFAEEVRQRLRYLMSPHRGSFGDAQDEVRARARQLWEDAGRPAGRDLDFWLQAERELANKP